MSTGIHHRILSLAAAAAVALWATPASAQTCGVLELTGGGKKITKNVVVNITSLIVSEIDIQGDFEFTMQHGSEEFDNGCPGNTSCLNKFASNNGYDRLIVGSVLDGSSDAAYKIKLRLYDPSSSSWERTLEDEVRASPEFMLSDIPPLVGELLTGERPRTAEEILAEQEEEDMSLDMDVDLLAMEDEDLDFDFGVGEDNLGMLDLDMTEEEIQAKREEEERRRREEEERERAEQERREREEEERRWREEEEQREREEADRRAREREEEERREADRRAREEEERRWREEEDRREREEAEERRRREREEEEERERERERERSYYDDEDDEDEDLIVISDSDEIVIGEDDEDDYDDYRDDDEPDDDEYIYGSYEDSYDDEDDYDDYDRRDDDYDDYDRRDSRDDYDRRDSRDSRDSQDSRGGYTSSSSRDRDRGSARDLDGSRRSGGGGGSRATYNGSLDVAHVCIKASAGGVYYYQGFFSYGGDIGIHVHRNALIDLQFKGWTASAIINNEKKIVTLIPLAIGASYKSMRGRWHPFIGGDLVFVLYQVHPETGARFAPGFKVRGGVDFKVTESFGFFAALNIGFAHAKYIKDIDSRRVETQLIADGTIGLLIQL